MPNLPPISRRHSVCVICEGDEEQGYFTRLTELNVWSSAYAFYPINAHGASNIPARFQDAYQNDRYEIIVIFCDTDKAPYREYALVKRKINAYLNKQKAFEKITIFANPCSMQIILLHFGEVSLKNQGKKTNASIIEQMTGVKDYRAHAEQIKELCGKIHQKTYPDMRGRVITLNIPDTVSASTNFITFLEYFESAESQWITMIRKYLRS